MICERFGLRPSDLVDTNNELYDNEKLHLDFLTAVARNEEASKTMDNEELGEHMQRVEEMKRKHKGAVK